MLHFAVPFSAGIGALYIYRKDRKTVIQRTDGKQFALFVPVHNVLSALPESDFLSISKGTVVCRRYIVNISNDGIYTMSDGRTFQGRKGFLGVLHFMLLIARSAVSRALPQCTDHSHCFSTSFSLFKSSGLAICSFMPVFFASCTSSAKAFAVMAMMGTLPRLPASERIAAVAS